MRHRVWIKMPGTECRWYVTGEQHEAVLSPLTSEARKFHNKINANAAAERWQAMSAAAFLGWEVTIEKLEG